MRFAFVLAVIFAVVMAMPNDFSIYDEPEPEFIFGVTELRYPDEDSAREVLYFAEGLLEGLGKGLVPSAFHCFDDARYAVTDMIDAYNELVRHHTRSFLIDTARGLDEIYEAYKACGKIEGEIKQIIELFESGGVSIAWHAGKSLVVHGREIYHWVERMETSFHHHQYKSAGLYMGEIIGTLL
ncbi:hypothetical protein J8273_6504 [Carpediemonas membranifera]|uniref:Uncharacterized protein n=1 Tax=Carpediemonas membranifera TaxID=201153 RepID=A0A8J6AYR8_9EUKA|nr:hypothetical protein J8273_6504 [Carpediemonas membranifera]|eukprot:KAG9391728.1 hypothetical protein J8273_6504 [Carpediemonas membranifera]